MCVYPYWGGEMDYGAVLVHRGADGAVGTNRDDCVVDGTTPVGEERCHLLFLFGGVFYLERYAILVCHVCLN